MKMHIIVIKSCKSSTSWFRQKRWKHEQNKYR